MAMHICQSFLLGFLCIGMVLSSGKKHVNLPNFNIKLTKIVYNFSYSFEYLVIIFIAGPAVADLIDPSLDCTGHEGPCEDCKERCVAQGFTKGGACLGMGWPLCCCLKNWNKNYI